jgi:hypothetical protein
MQKNSVSIQFHDFHPSVSTKNFIDSIVESIHSELPHGSTVKATFSKKDNLIKGMLNVNSFSGPFFTVAAAEDLHQVTVKLVDLMRRRLEQRLPAANGRRDHQPN